MQLINERSFVGFLFLLYDNLVTLRFSFCFAAASFNNLRHYIESVFFIFTFFLFIILHDDEEPNEELIVFEYYNQLMFLLRFALCCLLCAFFALLVFCLLFFPFYIKILCTHRHKKHPF